jgi:hypothetical protein
MPDELPAGDKAVYVFLEFFALGFALASVDRFVSKHWSAGTVCLLLTLLFFVTGIKWTKIKLKIGGTAEKADAPAFEIIFDSTNPGRQFWSLKVVGADANIRGIEYRLKIRNKTERTLREVKATTETIGPMGAMPARLVFDQTGEPTFSLDPGASAFVKLFFAPLPIIQPGTLTGGSSSAYGPIRVTVSALDTRTFERIFLFNPLTIAFNPFEEPMITPE